MSTFPLLLALAIDPPAKASTGRSCARRPRWPGTPSSGSWASGCPEGPGSGRLVPDAPRYRPPHASAPRPTPAAPPPNVVIIGAGPAGLTAAYELVTRYGITSTVLEADAVVGGISRTVERDGWRFDIGGHRFFTKVKEVEALLARDPRPTRTSCCGRA